MNMQKLLLLGRATKDAEIITSNAGKDFGVFSVAVNRYLGKEKGNEPTFYECVMFNASRTEKLVEQVKKGDLIIVEGRPEADAYLSKEGEAKSKLKVIVDDWQVLK